MNLSNMAVFEDGDILDAVVIGTGAGGAPLLASLAAAGRRVVALEAGENRDPEQFVGDEVGAADLYWRGERLSGGRTPEAFGMNNSGIGVGGSTLHWGAFTPRPDARDLRLRSEAGVGADWPLTLEELLPFIRRVEAEIGVSGPSPYPWDPDRRYPLPHVAINAPAQAMQRGCAALGIRTAVAPAAVATRAIEQAHGPRREACIGCGYCHQGCRNGAKVSMDVTYLPLAVAMGAEIRPSCFVTGFERDTAGRITGVIYRRDGQERRQRCRAVVLCAGAIESPRLLLHGGLANSSGQVGRNYMGHVATQVWGTFAPEMRCHRGYPSSLITEDFVRPRDADFAAGYLIQSLGVVPMSFADQVSRGRKLWGRKLVDYLDGYNHVAGIGINGETLPHDDNRLTLSDEVDDSGLPKPLVTFSYHDNETAMSAHAERVMTAVWEAAGATDIWTFQRVAHTIGTCRMGHDPCASVVDAFGRSHDIDNLWICDNGVFPSALAANPALTIMALSLRTAEAFLRNH